MVAKSARTASGMPPMPVWRVGAVGDEVGHVARDGALHVVIWHCVYSGSGREVSTNGVRLAHVQEGIAQVRGIWSLTSTITCRAHGRRSG